MTHLWKVVPLSKGQLLDVREEDILSGGLYRKCDTYRGGGGYDQFPIVCNSFFGKELHEQFIVQLKGCNLDCPYCYVTRAGVWGYHVDVSTEDMVGAFKKSGLPVFHLMGGAPALQLKFWPELLDALHMALVPYVFHSDLMLTEGIYDSDVLKTIDASRSVLAVNIKGTDDDEWLKNTRKEAQWVLFWYNFRLVQRSLSQYYITYTGCSEEGISAFEEECKKHGIYLDNFLRYNIDLIEYDSLPHVDDVEWGAQSNV